MNNKFNPDIRKKHILDAAIYILNQKAYYNCPLDIIAKHAGVAKGTLYLYFKNKQELCFNVFFALIDDVLNFINQISEKNISSKDKLLILMQKISSFIAKHKQLFLALRQEMQPKKERLYRILHTKYNELIKKISLIVQEGIDNNEFKKYPLELISSVYLSLIFLAGHHYINYSFNKKFSKDKDIELNKIIHKCLTPKNIFNLFYYGVKK